MSVFPDESHEARIEDRHSGGRESKQSVTDLLSDSKRVGVRRAGDFANALGHAALADGLHRFSPIP